MDVSEVTGACVGPADELLDRVLTALAAGTSEQDVLARAATLVGELTGAAVAAVCEGSRAHPATGPGRPDLPGRGLARVVRDGGGVLGVPGLGRVHADVATVPGRPDVHVVAGVRTPDPAVTAVVVLVARGVGLVLRERRGHDPAAPTPVPLRVRPGDVRRLLEQSL